MKMSYLKPLAVLLMFVVAISCQQEESPVTNPEIEASAEAVNATTLEVPQEAIDITHNYTYKGQTFQVIYTLNEIEKTVVKMQGDVRQAEQLFSDEKGPGVLYFEDPVEDKTEINITVFDTQEELDNYLIKEKQAPADLATIPDQTARNCNSWFLSGVGDYYFYRHINYSTEMTSLRRLNAYYMGNHWVGSGNNDQMSSLILRKPFERNIYVSLRQHSCYGGRSLNFMLTRFRGTGLGVRNLRWFTLSRFLFWRRSWNDQVSSYLGVSW